MMQIRSQLFIPILLLVLLPCASPNLQAQSKASRADLFAGYSMMHLDAKGLTTGGNTVMGWGASITNNLSRNVGITFDSGGFYRREYAGSAQSNARAYTVMAGPTISFPTEKASPFIHVLVGVGILTATGSSPSRNFSEHAIAGAAGGGVDVPVARSVSIRLIEVDYFPVHHATGRNFSNIRWRSGVVLRIGGK